jgi:DNA-binding NarL/FixJ family response regulator
VPVTILLVDDHPIVRQGLRHLLDDEPDLKVLGEAGDGVEALLLVERLKPDIIIVDMMMPGLNGLEVLRQIKNISPMTRSIVLSMQSADAYVTEAVKNGAAGYVLKETGPSELVNALREVSKGNQYFSAKLAKRLEPNGLAIEDTPLDMYETLTTRERETLQMVAEGRSSAEIGKKLAISPRTVEIHRSNLMKKLNLGNQSELIRYAIKRGIIPINE